MKKPASLRFGGGHRNTDRVAAAELLHRLLCADSTIAVGVLGGRQWIRTTPDVASAARTGFNVGDWSDSASGRPGATLEPQRNEQGRRKFTPDGPAGQSHWLLSANWSVRLERTSKPAE